MNGSAEDTLGRIGECSIDAVVAIESLAYFPNLDATMKEMARVLKPGGLLVGHVPSMGYLRPSECHLFDEESVKERLEKAGLMAQEVSRTMGGCMAAFCRVFEWLSCNYFILSVFFPLLLLGTLAFRVRHRNGKYLFIIARKSNAIRG
jgi:SAM-dependent methyltransferase